MSKIESFCLIPELNLIVAGSNDNQLKLFKLQKNKETGALECNYASTIKKDSGNRVLEMSYSSTINHLIVLSSDNKFELIKVNLDNKDSILKKMLRHEKRKVLKRKREEADDADEDEDALENIKIDKEALALKIEEGSYDVGLHFSKKLAYELDVKSKAKSY
jgi:WD40 repeat protein